MDFKDNRNLAIGILLSLLSVLLTSTLFLSYKVVTAESINNDFMVKNQSDKAANGQGFTEGMYTGALRNMAEMNEAYGCVRRGIYQKGCRRRRRVPKIFCRIGFWRFCPIRKRS